MDRWARIKYQPCLTLGDNNSRITGCKRHIELSREAACEGTVLLKNNNNLLPLKKGTKVAIFGKAQIDYVKGGGGSGVVFCEYVRNIYDGLKQKNDIEVFDALSLYYVNYVNEQFKNKEWSGLLIEPEIDESLLKSAKDFADVAIITLNRFSAEEWDRKSDGTDPYFELSKQEKAMVETVTDNFNKVIVLINSGSMIDTSWFADNEKIDSALMIWQGGMECGLATADILVGDVTPSGKLVDTCAKSFDDYPSSEGFHESEDYVKYTEDIFVGYRYFETIQNMKERVVYPFGYGLSYTKFEISDVEVCKFNEKIYISANVKNTGSYAGKEVVQVYYNAPRGKITKPALELCSFKKTKLLKPGESESVVLGFNVDDMASFDDMGVICESAYVLEKGAYKVFIGNSVRNVKEIPFSFELSEDKIVKKCNSYCSPKRLGKRLTETGEYIEVEDKIKEKVEFPCEYVCERNIPENDEDIKLLIDVVDGKVSLDKFISQLSDEELFELTGGQPNTGVANTGGIGNLPRFGIPSPMATDGPAGVRIFPEKGVNTTAFPVATMLACTWNVELIEKIGIAGALETKENNLSIWLTPALNIHRSPLCGRNFEYYSEDPYISGKMAAAMVRGIQSQGIVATPKHFACNNKETNRFESDSIVSERALREIYLKGFEICVKESKPKLIMTSYNILNGTYPSENPELLQGILRNEWGFDGLIVTDWNNYADKEAEIISGNDIRMPRIEEDRRKKCLNAMKTKDMRNQLAISVKRLLQLIMWLE